MKKRKQNPKVLIIILNYNGLDLLRKHLPSVKATDYDNFSILIVDNGSTDSSLQYLRKKHPEVKVLQLSRNYGFAKANNLAFKKYPNYDYYCLLNNDMTVTVDWLKTLVKTAEKKSKIAGVGPKVLHSKKQNGKYRINSAGISVDDFYRGVDRYSGEIDTKQHNKIEEVEALTGGALLLRSKAVKDMGGFAPRMFFYYEDVDLSLRLRDAGWKLIYNPNAVVYHDHQATSKRLHTTFNMNFKANLNRIKSISRRFGIIAAALEAVRTLFEWIYCKISGKSLKDKVLDNIKKRRNAK